MHFMLLITKYGLAIFFYLCIFIPMVQYYPIYIIVKNELGLEK